MMAPIFAKGKVPILLIIIAIITKTQILNKRHPDAITFLQKHTTASQLVPVRLGACVLLQLLGRNPIASTSSTSLLGERILITGGSRGIGYEITKGLVERGAKQVLVASRNPKQGSAAVETIISMNNNNDDDDDDDPSHPQDIRFLPVDLSDLDSVMNLVDEIKKLQQQQQSPSSTTHKLDQLILNAGLYPAKHRLSKQGHEIAYATNVLGPHLLLRKLLQENLLKANSKVIVTVGELHVLLKGTTNQGCSSDFEYDEGDGQIAYCRSKIGVMVLFDQYLQRYPELHLTMVHPGVIDNGLVNDGQGNDGSLPKPLLLSNYEGAQTTLILATEKTTVRGGYYHNTLGLVHLPNEDIAKNSTLGQEMWDLAENLIQDYLS